MKLLLCRKCQDVVRLRLVERRCECGASTGRYVDEVNAVYEGKHAVPLGFGNASLARAVRRQPLSGEGERFEAFVIPVECPTFVKGR